MKREILYLAALIGVGCAAVSADVDKEYVVPGHERETAQHIGTDGPTLTSGIESIDLLGTIALGEEFAGLEGRMLRAREITVLPGGVVAVHRHESRPGLAYILEGELLEYRNDGAEPITRSVGAISFEKTGVVHWWANRSMRKATALVVDIVPTET